MPFQPKGETAQWRIIYDDAVRRLQLNPFDFTVITFKHYADTLGVKVQGNASIVQRANRQLLETHQRFLESVRGEGYRLDDPSRRVASAKVHEDRGVGEFDRMLEKITRVDKSLVPEQEIEGIDRYALYAMRMNTIVAREVARQGGEIEELKEQVQGELAGQAARLARIEEQLHLRTPELVDGEIVD
jgi:hypothetical protein